MDIELYKGDLRLDFPKTSKWLPIVRNLPDRQFLPEEGVWVAAHTTENWERMVQMDFPLDGIPEPTQSSYRVDAYGNLLEVDVPGSQENIQKCRGIPGNRLWDSKNQVWKAKASRKNVEYLLTAFPGATWTEEAQGFRSKVDSHEEEVAKARTQKSQVQEEVPEVRDYRFKTEPYDHQAQVFAFSRDREAFALHMEMGTGKTKVIIDTAGYQYLRDNIDGVLVVAPNSIKSVWEEEVATHLPDHINREVIVYRSSQGKGDREEIDTLGERPDRLKFLVMNVEGLSRGKAPEIARKFLEDHRALMVVDESTRIKNPKAKRTKKVRKLGALAEYRRTMTGTPVTKSPLDIFEPFNFLDPDILGYGSYYAFRNHFAIMGGFGGKQVVGYRNLEDLRDLVDPFTFRVTKEECLDLPDKVYQKHLVGLSEEQARLYKEMSRDMVATLGEDEQVGVTIVLTQMMRLQQILGGFLPEPEDLGKPTEEIRVRPIPGPNPKLNALQEIAEDAEGKMIVWCRFRPEIGLVADTLREEYGPDSVVEFHGGVDQGGRTEARRTFQDPSSGVRFFVANPATGGMGLTLTQAQTVVYYSNTFSLEDRLQSEDRAHRAGLEHKVTYVDLIARETLDVRLLETLREKKSLADVITGDDPQEWI